MTNHRHLLFIFLAIIFLFAGGCCENNKTMPVAKHGVLDLRGWDPVQDGPVALNGQWEFYWDRLLTPDDFAAGETAQKMSGFLTFPGFWNEYELNGHTLPREGQATFRLRILPEPESRQLTIRLLSIPAAYQVWANETLVASSGVVGRSDQTEIPDRSLVLTKIANNGSPIDLVMQISNHYFHLGGVQTPIMLAAPGALEQAHFYTTTWGLLFVGFMLSMTLYHFILYILRNKDISTLYFGLYCIVSTLLFVMIDYSDWLARSYLTDVDFVTVSTIVLISFSCSASIIYRFYRSLYRQEVPRLLIHICDIRGLIFIFIVLFMPGRIIYSSLQWFGFSTIILNACLLFILIKCFLRGHNGSLILLCGFIILMATNIHDIYFIIFSTNAVNLVPIGLFALALSQAVALAQRFSKSFSDVEHLSKQLENKNESLKEQISKRTQLEREIVSISEEERRSMSLDLHDGLCQQLTGARLRCAALLQKSEEVDNKNDELQQLSTLLDGLVDQAYDLSCGIWPLEHGATGLSLKDMVGRYSRSSGIPIEVREKKACDVCENIEITQIYRIAQEAIVNALKHAKPKRIVVSLDCASTNMVTLTVRDDGVGRPAAAQSKGGLGVSIMAHRALMIGGHFQIVDIDKAEGGGTMVVCSFPCRLANSLHHEKE